MSNFLGPNALRAIKEYVDDRDAANTNSMANNIAEPYSAASTYEVGDFCTYNGILYICITAVSSAEAFNSTKWRATNIVEAVLGLINTGM